MFLVQYSIVRLWHNRLYFITKDTNTSYYTKVILLQRKPNIIFKRFSFRWLLVGISLNLYKFPRAGPDLPIGMFLFILFYFGICFSKS